LDEATSTLEFGHTEAERVVQEDLDRTMTNRTSAIVAHVMPLLLVIHRDQEFKKIGFETCLLHILSLIKWPEPETFKNHQVHMSF
jgi:hypothetical protein